jgi:hypothetical protein
MDRTKEFFQYVSDKGAPVDRFTPISPLSATVNALSAKNASVIDSETNRGFTKPQVATFNAAIKELGNELHLTAMKISSLTKCKYCEEHYI